MDDAPPVTEPFPVFLVANRYLLYDVNTITHARKQHHILGTLIGGLPQAPQQNVFLGIPLQLTPEEARLLVDKKVAYIVDDVAAHKQGFLNNGIAKDDKRTLRAGLDRLGTDAARRQSQRAQEKKETALKKVAKQRPGAMDNWNDIPDDMFGSAADGGRKGRKARAVTPSSAQQSNLTPTNSHGSVAPPPRSAVDDEAEYLFVEPQDIQNSDASTTDRLPRDEEATTITPTTSYPPLTSTAPDPSQSLLPRVPSSYPVYKYVHSQGYFLAPGLRFGCQYMAYPGDPLRYHSHFLCNGLGWDEEFDLLDLVGGGRLGTGVKKGFLLGGQDPRPVTKDVSTSDDRADNVRVFCVEWGGM